MTPFELDLGDDGVGPAGGFLQGRAMSHDAEDAAAAVAARREAAETESLPVPWEEVKAELGLV